LIAKLPDSGINGCLVDFRVPVHPSSLLLSVGLGFSQTIRLMARSAVVLSLRCGIVEIGYIPVKYFLIRSIFF
jgi:hypothetical protein